MNYTSFLLTMLTATLLLISCGGARKRINHQTYYEQAMNSLEEGNSTKALMYIDKALNIKQMPHYLAFKATLLYQIGNNAQSKGLFEQLLSHPHLSPSMRTQINNNYACLLNHEGNTKKAQKIWLTLTKDPAYTTKEVAWFNLGMLVLQECHHKQHKKAALKQGLKKAHDFFAHALQLNPAYTDAYYFKAQTALLEHDYKKARVALENVVRLAPHSSAEAELINLKHMLGQEKK
jgi:Tfp pilus assembly protein PilF